MTPSSSIREALSDRTLLGDVLDGSSWYCWRVLLTAAMGEALTDGERETFRKLTGRHREPNQRCEELCVIAGRRGGKSKAMATLAAYIAGLCKHPLTRGEKGVLLCIAPDQRQATIVLDYAAAAFEQSPILKQLITNRTSDALELSNGISVEVRAASFRRLRGPTYIAVICDEAAFWHSDESANPDIEIVNAVRPGLATTGGPLIIASSPYARRGILWQAHKQNYGADGDKLILVAQGESRIFNPSLPAHVVKRAYERDPANAAAEYGAEFRRDIESFVDLQAVEACVAIGVYERAPIAGVTYAAFVDPSGGSGGDSMTLCIGHRENDVAIVDAVRERPPQFSPADCVAEFAAVLKPYRVTTVQGDRWGGDWPGERFNEHGIRYEAAAKPKSDLYRDLLPALNSRKVDLLDHQKLVTQIVSLERRTARGGKDSIDHPKGDAWHDDLANAVAGLVAMLATQSTFDSSYDWAVKGSPLDPASPNYQKPEAPSWAQQRSLYEHPAMFGANVFPFRR